MTVADQLLNLAPHVAMLGFLFLFIGHVFFGAPGIGGTILSVLMMGTLLNLKSCMEMAGLDDLPRHVPAPKAPVAPPAPPPKAPSLEALTDTVASGLGAAMVEVMFGLALLALAIFAGMVFFIIVDRLVFPFAKGAIRSFRQTLKAKETAAVVAMPETRDDTALELRAFRAACKLHGNNPTVQKALARILRAFADAQEAMATLDPGSRDARLVNLRKVALGIENGPARALAKLPAKRGLTPLMERVLDAAAKLAEQAEQAALDAGVEQAEIIAKVYEENLPRG